MCTKWVKSDINEKNGHFNKTIQYEELEIIILMTTCDKELDKYKETLGAYYIKVGEKTLITSENK